MDDAAADALRSSPGFMLEPASGSVSADSAGSSPGAPSHPLLIQRRGGDGSATGETRNHIKYFDAFPKVKSSYEVKRTKSGGIASLIAYVIMAVLFTFETIRFFRPPQEFSFIVDGGKDVLWKPLPLQFDVEIATECDKLSLLAADSQGEPKRIDEWCTMEAVPSVHGKAGGCRIKGKISTDRLRGHIAIIPKLLLKGCVGSLISSSDQGINFSHTLHKFAFSSSLGKFRWNRRSSSSPLDGTTVPDLNPQQRFTYHLVVVPWIIASGPGSGGGVASTEYAYAVKGFRKQDVKGGFGPVDMEPGLYFQYSVDGMAVHQHDVKSLPALRYFIRVLGIVSGVYVALGAVVKYVLVKL